MAIEESVPSCNVIIDPTPLYKYTQNIQTHNTAKNKHEHLQSHTVACTNMHACPCKQNIYMHLHTHYDSHTRSTKNIPNYICDRICKKGSYTRTTSEHSFHHHSMDTSSDNPCVHVLWPTVYKSAFPEAAF